MRASAAEFSQNEERLKEYQRQQERLKALTANSDKVKSMSADVMIENLLKQDFVKPCSTNTENRTHLVSGLPNWLECESPDVPAAYKHLWAFVKTPADFADTQKVSQLLLTSGLHMEVLGFIWNLSNKTVPGQLNKQEFYIVLALVALAQSGYGFNNLSILNLIPHAPIPTLQTNVLEKFIRSPNTSCSTYVNQISPIRPVTEDTFSLAQFPSTKASELSIFSATTTNNGSSMTINEPKRDLGEPKSFKKLVRNNSRDVADNDNCRDFPKTSHFPCIGSSPTAELEDEDDFSEFQSASISESPQDIIRKKEDSSFSSQSDEFTDFQCAEIISDPLETVVISQKKEIPKVPLPKNLGGKLTNLRTNIMKIFPESEKKLKVLSQSETLSTLPESKIPTNNKVSTVTSISVVTGSRDIGMRLANHSLGSRSDKSKHQRHKHKQPVHVDEIAISTKFGTMDDLFPKCFQRTSSGTKTFVLKETKIGHSDSFESELSSKSGADINPESFQSGKITRTIEIPMLGTFNETILPTQTENNHTHQPTMELFSVEEDKYSALREVELEMKMKNNESNQSDDNKNMNSSDGVDDFGEFLSAEIPSIPTEEPDLWGEWTDPDPTPETNYMINERPLECPNENESDHKSRKIDNNRNMDDANVLDFDLLNLTEDDNNKTIATVPEFDLEKFSNGSNKSKMEDDPFNSLTESGQVQLNNSEKPILDFDDFMLLNGSSGEVVQCNTSTLSSSNLNEDFGMFFTSECTLSPLEENRDEFLPNLNLNILSTEGNEQETMRKKCLVACLNLIQQGLDILNGVSSAVVLAEVLSTQEAINYLNNLNIIYQISKRIGSNSGEFSSNQEDIERVWQKVVRYCYDYHITLREDLDNSASMGTQCQVCLGFIGNDTIDKGLNSYHPSCANFWVNCVESELPCPI